MDYIDGAGLADGDGALVITTTHTYTYVLDDDSGAAESVPDVIEPDTNAGTKRWVLKASNNQRIDTAAAPIFAGGTFTAPVAGVDPVAGPDLVTKEYADALMGTFKTFFLSDTASGVGALEYAYSHETGEVESTIVTAGLATADDQLINGWITEALEPGTTTIHAGVMEFHFHAKKGASNQKTTQLYFVLSSVDADGTSNKTTIATSEVGEELTDTETGYHLHGVVSVDTSIAADARLILDVYANVGSGSQNSVVTIYMEGTKDSYWTARVDGGIWQTQSDVLDDLATTDATGAELTELTDSSETTLHSHAGGAGAPQEGYFEVTKDDTQTLVEGATTKIEFDDEVADPDGVFDAAGDNDFTCPATGKYLFTAQVTVDDPHDGDRLVLYIFVDGSLYRRIGGAHISSTNSATITGSALIGLTLNQVVDIRVFLGSISGNHSLVTSGTSHQFSGIRIF